VGDPRRDLLEQLEPFAGQAVFELHESGRIADACIVVRAIGGQPIQAASNTIGR
jgi:hypothetical protein